MIRAVVLVVTAIILLGQAARADMPSRSTALKSADQSIAKVRESPDSVDVLDDYLIMLLARPIGDDPRVLALCDEVAARGTNTEALGRVLGALEVINQWHPAKAGRDKQKEQIAAAARKIQARDSWTLKNRAAGLLGSLGGKYADEAEQHYVALLKSDSPEGASTPAQRDEVYTNAIRQLIKLQRKSAYPLIRKVTKKHDLLATLKKWIAEDPSRRNAWMGNEKFVLEWERVAGGKR